MKKATIPVLLTVCAMLFLGLSAQAQWIMIVKDTVVEPVEKSVPELTGTGLATGKMPVQKKAGDTTIRINDTLHMSVTVDVGVDDRKYQHKLDSMAALVANNQLQARRVDYQFTMDSLAQDFRFDSVKRANEYAHSRMIRLQKVQFRAEKLKLKNDRKDNRIASRQGRKDIKRSKKDMFVKPVLVSLLKVGPGDTIMFVMNTIIHPQKKVAPRAAEWVVTENILKNASLGKLENLNASLPKFLREQRKYVHLGPVPLPFKTGTQKRGAEVKQIVSASWNEKRDVHVSAKTNPYYWNNYRSSGYLGGSVGDDNNE